MLAPKAAKNAIINFNMLIEIQKTPLGLDGQSFQSVFEN
jgi:hypothetical protein